MQSNATFSAAPLLLSASTRSCAAPPAEPSSTTRSDVSQQSLVWRCAVLHDTFTAIPRLFPSSAIHYTQFYISLSSTSSATYMKNFPTIVLFNLRLANGGGRKKVTTQKYFEISLRQQPHCFKVTASVSQGWFLWKKIEVWNKPFKPASKCSPMLI